MTTCAIKLWPLCFGVAACVTTVGVTALFITSICIVSLAARLKLSVSIGVCSLLRSARILHGAHTLWRRTVKLAVAA